MASRWTWAFGLLLLALGGCGEPVSAPEKSHRDLAEVTAGLRLVEPRLSGGVAAAPCKVVSDGPTGSPRCSELAEPGEEADRGFRKIARRIDNEAGRSQAPEALGVLYLLRDWVERSQAEPRQRGSAGRLDTSIRLLEEASASKPGQADTLNDLAGAYYVRAQELGAPEDYLRSLDAADRAVAADGSLAEARFNLALALQALNLTMDTLAAWDKYLGLDPESPWSLEAEARKEALRRTRDQGSWETWRPLLETAAERGDARKVMGIVARFRQASREHAERKLLPGWAEAWLAGRPADAERDLRIARAIGTALAEVNDDRMVLDAVAVIDALAKRNDLAGIGALARGHLDYAEGYDLYKDQRGEEGAVRLAAARDAFRRARSPFEGRADLYLAGCDYRHGLFEETLGALDRLRREWRGKPYPSLLNEMAWMEAATRASRGEMASAIRGYKEILASSERRGETDSAATVAVLLAELLDQLGLRKEAWTHRYRALAAAPQVRNAAYRTVIYMNAADAALEQGFPAIALRFWNEAVRHAGASHNELLLADILSWRSLLRSQLGNAAGSEKDVSRARESLERHPDEAARRRSRATLDLIEGQLRAGTDLREAVRLLTGALEVFGEMDHQPLSLLAYRTRAQAYRAAGDREKAEEDLDAALRVYEGFGRDLQAEEERLALLGVTEAVFDELISLQALDLGAADRAFDSADRSHTRVLPDYLSRVPAGAEERERLLAAEPDPLGLAEVRRRLPAGTVLVQYSVLADRLLTWVVRREGWSFQERAISAPDLRARVARLRSFGSPGWTGLSAGLYDLLLRPWISGVGEGETLVVVPDKTLHSVPFAALRDRESGRFLVEEHRLAVSPSATLYTRALGRERRPSSSPRVLVMGDPAFDQVLFSTLRRLPAAEQEAKAVAGFYPGSDLLIGPQATRREFLSRVRQYDWVHFAGHSMVNLQNPLLSMLVLAPSAAGDTGTVTAREIYSMDLGGTRMVVLSACETGVYDPEGEGASALARAFLAAGVPTVVASLWKVDDQPTSRLFQAFHQSLRAGSDPVDALREAQIGLLRGPEADDRSPEAWAAFEVIGASTH